MEKTLNKLKQNNGFTISELLVATIILLLTSGMLITCIQLGLKQLYKQTAESEAQMLCTMLSTAVQDELTYATGDEVTDIATGKFVSYSKGGKKVGFYIATETTDDNPENFAFEAVTDDATHAGTNLGKIYLRTPNETDPTKIETHGLVSTGAYNIENSTDGSLQAGMQLTPLEGGYEVKIDVYNGSDVTKPLATKDFYVGRITADLGGSIVPNTNITTYTVKFDANGGSFSDGTSVKEYKGLLEGDEIAVPADPTRPGFIFNGWNPTVSEPKVTVTGDQTYTAKWRGSDEEARALFFRKLSDYNPDRPGENNFAPSVHAKYGRILGGRWVSEDGTQNQEIPWPIVPDDEQTGKTFVGWRDSSGNEYYIYKGDTWVFTKNEIFEPIYEQKYTLTFYNGTNVIGKAIYIPETNSYGYMDKVESWELNHSDAGNWTFDGWYSNPNTSAQNREFDENGDATSQNSIINAFNAGTYNVKLYAGYKNTKELYLKTDNLSAGNRFLIIGGDATGENRRVLSNNGNNISTRTVTVKGNTAEKYVLGTDGSAHEWNSSGTSKDRLYIQKVSNGRYLDFAWIYHDIQLKNSTDVREWVYLAGSNRLEGYYDTTAGINAYLYMVFDGTNFKAGSNSNGNIHIYQYRAVGQALSFNGAP